VSNEPQSAHRPAPPVTEEDVAVVAALLSLLEIDWAKGCAALSTVVACGRAYSGAKQDDEKEIGA
jgi:hypothetical protein